MSYSENPNRIRVVLRGDDKVVGYVPRVRVDILLDDTDVDAVIDALRDPETGIRGQGVFWVTSVDQHGRL